MCVQLFLCVCLHFPVVRGFCVCVCVEFVSGFCFALFEYMCVSVFCCVCYVCVWCVHVCMCRFEVHGVCR